MAFTFTEAFLRVLFCLVHDCRMFARAFYIMEDPSSVLCSITAAFTELASCR